MIFTRLKDISFGQDWPLIHLSVGVLAVIFHLPDPKNRKPGRRAIGFDHPCTVCTKLSVVIFWAEKLLEAFALQKLLRFFGNVLLTNNAVTGSFEQLGSDYQFLDG